MNKVLAWIEQNYSPELCTSEEFLYNAMESQSGKSLPGIYVPFDAGNIHHWADRGSTLDFLWAVQGKEKRLLDFGPGDGWPSLPVAPDAKEIVGLDSSYRRVGVCRDNAKALGLTNVSFQEYAPGDPLPFPDSSFDGIIASSSVEQTPDPSETLKELYRLLRPGGRLRIHYEALNGYAGGQEQDVYVLDSDGIKKTVILFDRRIEEEIVLQYALDIEGKGGEAERIARECKENTLQTLESLKGSIIHIRKCLTRHPSGATLMQWLKETGFSQVRMTHQGKDAATGLFQALSDEKRPTTSEGVRALLEPVIQVVVDLEAPLDSDSMITALK